MGRDEREQFNFAWRGLNEELVKAIYEFTGDLALSPEVGLAAVEIVQPTEKSFELVGGVGVKVIRRATPKAQPTGLTAWMEL